MTSRTRVLFFGEAITMAHVARPYWLAARLPADRYEVHFASNDLYRFLLKDTRLHYWPIRSKGSREFLDAVETGRALYQAHELIGYAHEELALIGDVAPDVVIGDFRHSLSVSARVAGVPYLGLINAYWSPYSPYDRFPVPEIRGLNLAGLSFMPRLMPWVTRGFLWFQARALNAARRHFGLSPYRTCLDAFTSGDQTLYYDIEALVPLRDAPAHHHYLGPVSWTPEVDLPGWWDRLAPDRPTAYVSMGSSGNVGLVGAAIDALRSRRFQVIVSTGGRFRAPAAPDVFEAEYLPGDQAAARADLVVCNGGSPSAYQAFAEGVPVIGIPANMDQLLAMRCIERYGAGLTVRMAPARAGRLPEAIDRIMATPSFRQQARSLASAFADTRPVDALQAAIGRAASARTSVSAAA